MTEVPSGAGVTLKRLAGAAFLLLMVTTTGPIAPMGISTALCGVLTVAALIARRERWPRTPVDAAAIGWFVAMVIAAWFAIDRAHSLPRITKAFFPLLVGLAAWHARERRAAERIVATYLAASGVIAVIGVALWFAHGASFANRARGLTGHYMTFSGQLLIEVLVAIGVAVCDARPRWRFGAALSALAVLAALAVTFTRSAWIGLFVGVAVIAGATWPLALGALVLVAIVAVVFAPGAWRARLTSIVDPNHPWNQQRVHMWHAGLRMFRDHPLTGVGLQDLKPIYERYKEPGATEPAGHLHDVFVQILATMGAIGMAAFLWLYSSLVACAAAGLRPMLKRRGFAAGVRLGVLAALAGFIVAGLFEWNFGDEELLYPLYTLVGLAFVARGWAEADGT